MPDVPAVGLFLGAPLFYALDALVQLLQQVRILFRLAERLDKRQRKPVSYTHLTLPTIA